MKESIRRQKPAVFLQLDCQDVQAEEVLAPELTIACDRLVPGQVIGYDADI